jgi:hypothetical protein
VDRASLVVKAERSPENGRKQEHVRLRDRINDWSIRARQKARAYLFLLFGMIVIGIKKAGKETVTGLRFFITFILDRVRAIGVWGYGHKKTSFAILGLLGFLIWYCPRWFIPVPPPVPETVVFFGGSDAPDRRGDVIFIHGLGGNVRTTWQGTNPEFFWPKALGEDFPNVGFWGVSYNASPSEWLGTTMPLTDRSKNVLELLRLHNLNEHHTVFVVHSLGGLVVKQMLRDALTLNKSVWEEIAGQTITSACKIFTYSYWQHTGRMDVGSNS